MAHAVEFAGDPSGVGRVERPPATLPVTGPARDREGSKPRQRRRKKPRDPEDEKGEREPGNKGKRIDIRA